ncbi:MAG: polyprenyl synthetase family protein, partial [Promicromonosporaceae bacterium]|nr:polyprenyl synthetase family protein [Promicromonosporaceae bacterium]
MAVPASPTFQVDQRLTQLAAQVEQELLAATTYFDPLAQDAARHLLSAGGKRLRPILVLLTAAFGEASHPDVIKAAVVVELTHLATLYHDDVMDSAPLRRGAPSAHAVWGNQVAILTGDLLFARASAIVAGLGPEAVRIQAETFERLCLGQLHETIGPGTDDDAVEFYLQVLRDKTASLTATAARFGAMFAGASVKVQAAVADFGERLGVAFQLADDVLDLTSHTSGKRPGTDLREQVATMPVLLLRRRVASGAASAEEVALADSIAGDLSDDDELLALVERLRVANVVA